MNHRIKLLILVLLAAILCLAAAIAAMALEGSRMDPSAEGPPSSESAIRLYVENGLWGIRTSSGRALTTPNWSSLQIMSDTVLVAKEGTGSNRFYGMINHKGETLVPFVYSNISRQEHADLWIAALPDPENNRSVYHLYRSDGSLWSEEAWEVCSYQNGKLMLQQGKNSYEANLTAHGLSYRSWHSEHPVGLRRLIMKPLLHEIQRMASAETLHALGDAAAYFLSYLFVSPEIPLDSALIGNENSDSLAVSGDYLNCRLESAHVSGILPKETTGFPCYLLQIQVRYQRLDDQHNPIETIQTAMFLTMAQNANGSFVYTEFHDPQAALSAAARFHAAQNAAAAAS